MITLDTPTHFVGFVEDAEAPRALLSTSDDPNAELVICVGSKFTNVYI